MAEIYKKAAYVLAVPDLHLKYLKNNPANKDTLDLIDKYKESIYKDILNNHINQSINKKEIAKKENKYVINDHQSTNEKDEKEDRDIKTSYQFLASLIEDWSNRARVISEYFIAKEKYEKHGTPFKYILISLLHREVSIFLPYPIDCCSSTAVSASNNNNYNNISYLDVDSSGTFINFLKTRFTQRSHLDMLLNSNINSNEDRFYAILPSWKKYHHLIKYKSTISSWNITDMVSVRLKLYELMEDDDLWEKARLLYACTCFEGPPILPSYASQYTSHELYIIEKDDANHAYEYYLDDLLSYTLDEFRSDEYVQQIIKDHGSLYAFNMFGKDDDSVKQIIMNNESSLYTENLIKIQFNSHHHYLSVKATKYFTYIARPILGAGYDSKYFDNYSLKEDDKLRWVFIPFFTYTVPGYTDLPPENGTFIELVGNFEQNKWLTYGNTHFYTSDKIYNCDGYTFNIY
ncbi:unnamed protein product [Cunninghamella echinulata]